MVNLNCIWYLILSCDVFGVQFVSRNCHKVRYTQGAVGMLRSARNMIMDLSVEYIFIVF